MSAPGTALPDLSGENGSTNRLVRLLGRHGPKLAMAAIVVALAALGWVVSSATTGQDAASQSLPAEVDRLIPASGGNVLVQSTIGIDVADGYTASLIVDGTPITEPISFNQESGELTQDGLVMNAETGEITYTPRPDGLVERFETGRNCVQAKVWATEADPNSGRDVSWCFLAT